MTAEDKQRLINYLEQSAENIETAEFLLNNHSKPSYSIICFLCQQASEYAAKEVFRVKQPEQEIEKTHEIATILKNADVPKDEQHRELYYAATAMKPYSVIIRYGDSHGEKYIVERRHAIQAIEYAKMYYNWAKAEIIAHNDC